MIKKISSRTSRKYDVHFFGGEFSTEIFTKQNRELFDELNLTGIY